MVVTDGSELVVSLGVTLISETNSKIILNTGGLLRVAGSVLLVHDSQIIVENDADMEFLTGSVITAVGNANISGDACFADGSEITVKEKGTLNFALGNVTIEQGCSIKLERNSKLVVDQGTYLIISSGTVVELSEGAEIIVETNANMTATGTTFSYVDVSGKWVGINAMSGSSVSLDNVTVSGAYTGILAFDSCLLSITNSTFNNCYFGVSLTNCSGFTLDNNSFYGRGEGVGISLTHIGKDQVKNNIVENFSHGLMLTLSRPEILKNKFRNNVNSGIFIT